MTLTHLGAARPRTRNLSGRLTGKNLCTLVLGAAGGPHSKSAAAKPTRWGAGYRPQLATSQSQEDRSPDAGPSPPRMGPLLAG